jgi:hypothetical protein
VLDADHHAPAVDVDNLEGGKFGGAQPGAVSGGQGRLIAQPASPVQQARYLPHG